MSKKELLKLKKLLKSIEKSKQKLSNERDHLRILVEEAEEIADSIGDGVEVLEQGIASMSESIKTMSQLM